MIPEMLRLSCQPEIRLDSRLPMDRHPAPAAFCNVDDCTLQCPEVVRFAPVIVRFASRPRSRPAETPETAAV
jgi:hypothetical protein